MCLFIVWHLYLTRHANHQIFEIESEPLYVQFKYVVYFSGGGGAYLRHPMSLVANSGGCYEDRW